MTMDMVAMDTMDTVMARGLPMLKQLLLLVMDMDMEVMVIMDMVMERDLPMLDMVMVMDMDMDTVMDMVMVMDTMVEQQHNMKNKPQISDTEMDSSESSHVRHQIK